MTEKRTWIYDLLLIAVLMLAAYFRVVGLNWDENQHLHPDERFLTMVETALQPRKCAEPGIPVEACPNEQKVWIGISDYFNTAASTLNPHNRGYGFFVYGTLPIFIVRYLAELLGQAGYDQVHLVGRQVSAIADLGVIVLLYILAARLYGRRVALLSAAFSAFTVMQIQQSHFFTVDNPANFFTLLTLWFAVLIVTKEENGKTAPGNHSNGIRQSAILREPLFLYSLGFGIALGMAVASKLNAAPLALLLPAAFLIRYYRQKQTRSLTPSPFAKDQQSDRTFAVAQSTDADNWSLITLYLIIAALATALTFRIFQPYAFSGLGLNEQWLGNIRELRAQSSGDVDVPFALQWARRAHVYSFQNLTVWGLGLPLGILAWLSFLWMGWRLIKGEWRHMILWGWSAFYFLWQSMAFNPTMRYQLPIYPLLCMMAAWSVIELWHAPLEIKNNSRFSFVVRLLTACAGILVLLLTAGWAYAFTRIYTQPHPRVAAARWIYQNLPGPINLHITVGSHTGSVEANIFQQPLPFPYGGTINPVSPYTTSFVANQRGDLSELYLPHVISMQDSFPSLSVTLASSPEMLPGQLLSSASIPAAIAQTPQSSGEVYVAQFNPPVPVDEGQTYFLRIESTGEATLAGAAPINESSWDDGLPLRLDGYDGFGGLYNGGLNLELYWDDNLDKLNRFVTTLSQGDYVFITSNRQWASVTRIPERFPLTSAYYRLLIGCPEDRDIIWCYNVARPGQFHGRLGYDLVAVFESFPTLDIPGSFHWEINDEFAEEAFTVYDHPKVLIFQKRPDFDAASVQNLLGAVDLTHVVHLTPKNASNFKNLMLSPEQLTRLQAGGTWSELFNYQWLQNRYPVLGALLWYLFIFVLGLCSYPLARLALPGLGDHGYAVSRTLGLVLLAYLAWLGGSVGVPYTRLNISVICILLVVTGLALGWNQREALRAEWKSKRGYILTIETLFLCFFILDLLIRLGNPDLWHQAKGGERPMDFSYFNAILKGTSFPPYDPWYAGGYINYYYFGYVLAGTPVKLLGIVPSIAYNMILPTFFALVAVGAFAIGWNLLDASQDSQMKVPEMDVGTHAAALDPRFVSGLTGSLMLVLLGNLGTVRMLFQGFQRMAAPGGIITDANIVQRWLWAVQGFIMSLTGAFLPIGRGDWYWFPSRVIPAPNDVEPITEFPFFTFLYSDLHAHMIVLPITLFIILWAISFLKARARMHPRDWVATFGLGALMIGALRPTNTWDLYTYFPLAALAVGYTLLRHADWKPRYHLPGWIVRIAPAVCAVGLLYLLSSWLYAPYTYWYSQAYGAVGAWFGSHTPLSSYFTHWGLFLFVIAAWLAWETRQWMAATPVSALDKLRPYQAPLEMSLAAVLVLFLYFAIKGIWIGWLALPLALWAGLLILRPNQPGVKRGVLLMIGTALILTIAVELVVLRGDIGRMNTVFKLYLQAWTLFAVCAAAAFGWLMAAFNTWYPRWRNLFQWGVMLLLAGTFLFTLSAATDKISDRLAPNAPHTLDSMTYMAYAQLWDGNNMDLSEDYRAIRWMQDNVRGSPVIVEANCSEYRWCTRYTIYTGLPGVVGWNWHQRQQRALFPPNWITDRINEIGVFYTTGDIEQTHAFLKKYNVKYILVGQLERNIYPLVNDVDGLLKFEQYDGVYWRSVFRESHTVIYEVLQ